LLSGFDYEHIPRHFEEALLLFVTSEHPDASREAIENLRFSNLKIRPQTIDRFQAFANDLNAINQRSMSVEHFQSIYKDTYWYYFFSP
jgi:uncharacterized protein YPO0396